MMIGYVGTARYYIDRNTGKMSLMNVSGAVGLPGHAGSYLVHPPAPQGYEVRMTEGVPVLVPLDGPHSLINVYEGGAWHLKLRDETHGVWPSWVTHPWAFGIPDDELAQGRLRTPSQAPVDYPTGTSFPVVRGTPESKMPPLPPCPWPDKILRAEVDLIVASGDVQVSIVTALIQARLNAGIISDGEAKRFTLLLLG